MLEEERLRWLTHDVQLKLKKEKREIRDLKESRRAELVQAATGIFDWLRGLAGNQKGRRILSTLGEVVIFRDCYHNYRAFGGERA